MSHTPTPEQAAVIDAFAGGESLVVVAVAGAGKTTTLRMASETLATTKPRHRGLYVAYNKPLAAEARKVFPATVDCRTAHSVAFASHGRTLAHRLDAGRMTNRQAAEIMYAGGARPETRVLNGPVQLAPEVILTPSTVARLALATVDRYCQTADDEIATGHVPHVPGLDHATQANLATLVCPIAQLAWKDLTHPRGRLRFTPDVYLKMWALSRPRIGADFILFDEAQDANPVLAAVLRDQRHTQQVAVGDPYQQLYAWRGAIDALADWPADQRLTLAQSFRFGEAVADRANVWLNLLDAPTEVIGLPSIPSRVEPLQAPGAILCRSNGGAMARVMEHVDAGRRVHLVGGAADVKRLAEAALRLMDGRRADHPELVAFESWEAVREHAAQDTGSNLATLVKLIDDHGPDKLIAVAGSLATEAMADVVVSTGHKAKGRQWSTVQLAPDYREPYPRPYPDPDSYRRAVVVDAAEAMLLYVGVTRAVDVLDDFAVRWVHRLHDYGWPVVVRGKPRRAAGPGSEYRPDPVERIAAVAAVAPEYVRPVEADPLALERERLAREGRLTGMPEEQADWEAPGARSQCPRCGGSGKCPCDPAALRRWLEMTGSLAGGAR